MQTETLFRAAKALEAISGAIKENAPALGFTFTGDGGSLFVTLSGLPIGDDDAPEPNTIAGEVASINAYCENVPCEIGFSLQFAWGRGTAACYRVEAG